AAGRAVAIGLARSLRRADWTGADAVPGELAHATRRRTPAPGPCQGGDRGPGGRLRVRGGFRARLQAPRGPASRGVATRPVGVGGGPAQPCPAPGGGAADESPLTRTGEGSGRVAMKKAEPARNASTPASTMGRSCRTKLQSATLKP